MCFWNASVAPTRGRGSQSVRQVASRVRRLMSDGASLVALCEMDDASAANLEGRLGTGEVEVISACEAIGRSRWDIVIVASRASVCCESAGSQFGRSMGNIIRSAQSFDVLTESTSFRLYITHWRSRLTGKGFEHRRLAAETLRCAVAADLDAGTPVVVLGDFNDEPFDTPMSALRAVRDPRLVCKHPRQLLFNASWSLAGPPPREPWGRFGSYRYPGRTSTAYQLDQALVSAHFLDESRGWAPLARNRSDVEPEGATGHLPLELVLA